MRGALMQLSQRQERIIQIVKEQEPITGDLIADAIGLTKSTLRSDFAILTKTGILDAKPKVGYIYRGMNTPSFLKDTLSQTKVQEIMSQPVVVHPDMTIQDAVVELFMHDSGSLYVCENGETRLIGVVSRKDLLQGLAMGQSPDTLIALIMTRMPNIVTILGEQTVMQAAQLIVRHEVDSLPVLDSDESVLGKISKTNIVNLVVEMTGED